MTQQLITLLTVMCLCRDVFSVIVIHLYYMKPKIWKCSHQLFIIVILIVMIVLIEEDKKSNKCKLTLELFSFVVTLFQTHPPLQAKFT